MSFLGSPLRASIRKSTKANREEAISRRRRLFLEPLEQRQLLTSDLNYAPVGVADSYSVTENEVLSISSPGVLANDSDADPLTAIHYSGPGAGSLTLNSDGSFIYTPNSNFVGNDSFTYQAYDGTLASGLTTVSLTINAAPPTNHAPVTNDDSYTVDENATLNISSPGVLTNDTDADNDALAAILVSGPTNGTLTMNADGSFTYTPAANYSGSDSFTYTLPQSAWTTVYLTVNSVNDLPTLADLDRSYDAWEDTQLVVTGDLLTGASDPDSYPIWPSLLSGPTHGTVEFTLYGSFVYTPNPNYNGPDSFTYQVGDGYGYSSSDTVSLNVQSVNDPPVASTDAYTLDEDYQCFTADVTSNDDFTDGPQLIISLANGPASGSVALAPSGFFTYLPNANFNGNDGFWYYYSDGAGSQVGPVYVSLTITPVNDAPDAVNDNFSTNEDTQLTGSIFINDSDVDTSLGNQSVYISSWPTHGSVLIGSNGDFTYTPEANFNGVDTFTYWISDMWVMSNLATVTINVTPVNDAPIASDHWYSTDEDTPLAIDATSGLLCGAADLDLDDLDAAIVDQPTHGTLTIDAETGSFVYTPAANYNGPDGFSYTASDGTDVDLATVSLWVNRVNDAPVAVYDGNPETLWTYDHPYWTLTDTDLVIRASEGVLANDNDPDNDQLTSILVDQPIHGFVALNPDGSFTYTPISPYTGVDKFTYRAFDGQLVSEITTVFIAVNEYKVQLKVDGIWTNPAGPITLWAGEPVHLRGMPDGPAKERFQRKWTITGTTLTKYEPSVDSAKAFGRTDVAEEQQFYWVSGGAQTAQVAITIGGKPPMTSNTLAFTVNKPTNTVSSVTSDVYQFGRVVQFGNIENPDVLPDDLVAGIAFTRNGANPAVDGEFAWVQLVSETARIEAVIGGDLSKFRRETGGYVLDIEEPDTTDFRYPPDPPGSLTTTNDSPSQFFVGSWRTVERHDDFKMYLMWKSATAGSRYVPICVTEWNFGFTSTSTDGLTWATLKAPFAPNPTSKATNTTPEWTTNIIKVKFKADV